jgi:hypothetical protein
MGLEAASIPGFSPMANDLTCWISDRSGRFAEGACVPAVRIFSSWTLFRLTMATELAREDISFSCSFSASSTVRA